MIVHRLKTKSHRESDFDTSLWDDLQMKRYAERERKRLSILKRLIEILRVYFKGKDVRGVYLFGSILREGCFYEFSDIDIAVEGLKEDYFRICTEIERLIDMEVDLVEVEMCKFKNRLFHFTHVSLFCKMGAWQTMPSQIFQET